MKNFLFFVTFLTISTLARGQDIHLSQFYNSPLSLNPAMTGLMNFDVRLAANYRNQWSSVTVPFQTLAVSADANILAGFADDDFFGAGLLVTNDKAGDAQLRTTQVHISAAYAKSLGGNANNFISLGGQFGVAARSLNYSKLTFDSQFDGDILNPNIASGENLDRSSYSYVDFSAGAAWYLSPNDLTTIYSGVAIAHLNEPNVSFYEGLRENLFKKLTLHLGAELGLNESFSVVPSGIFLLQGPHQEINIGVLGKLNLTPDLEMDEMAMALHFGTMHRFKDAQIFTGRVDIGPVAISLSYDLNISNLSRASKARGGPEIAVLYRTNLFNNDRDKRGGVKCPAY